jgi:hypothetical protein
MSRSLERIERSNGTIAEQFSIENEHSVPNKLYHLLNNAMSQIFANLTLDNEHSALSRINKELQDFITATVRSNQEFQADVRQSLAVLNARKAEIGRSPSKGTLFETELGRLLTPCAQRLSDVPRHVANNAGAIKNCKIGDYVIELGANSRAPGAKIVFEAKEDASYDIGRALKELEEARKNRSAQVGVFVFSRKTTSENVEIFSRYQNDILIVWDADDPVTDIVVKVAYSVASALAVAEGKRSDRAQQTVYEIEKATRAIGKQIQYLDEIRKLGDTVKGHGEKITDRAEKVKNELERQVATLDAQLHVLKITSEDDAPEGMIA